MTIKTMGSQKEAQIINIGNRNSEKAVLHYNIDYDSTKPEETIRNFVGDIREMIARYDGDKARLIEIEAELQDLLHYIEIANFKRVTDGYKLYRKIAELRRERRACKNEIDLLWPIYEYFHATEVLNRLTTVQGNVSKAKEAIDQRVYGVRTDILDDWMEEKKPETTVTTVEETEPYTTSNQKISGYWDQNTEAEAK